MVATSFLDVPSGTTTLFGYAFGPGLLRALPIVNDYRVPLLGVYLMAARQVRRD